MRMAVSYVLVTAAAVVLVDGIVLGLLLPRMLASSNNASRAAVATQAGSDAKRLSVAAVNVARKMPAGTTSTQLMQILGTSRSTLALGLSASHGTAAVSDRQCLAARRAEALVLPDGTVIASSNTIACPAGMRLGLAQYPGSRTQGEQPTANGPVVWAVGRVMDAPAGRLGRGSVVGSVYLEAAAGSGGGLSFAQAKPMLVTGGLVLGFVIPVGTIFGLLSTRRVIRRIKRLAEVTTTVAGGDFRPRVQVSGGDEIGRLEDAFNRMTGRLSAAVNRERLVASASARQTERARITRELHDSISQDLFSLSLLAAGLRKSLGDSGALRPEVEAMQRTAARAMREMQAMLLELRPVDLEDAGLAPAIAGLCQAYQARLSINVTADLGEVSLDPAAEHAVLRVTQEALGNAVRHGQPETILVRLGQVDGAVTVEIRDDGCGFDPQDIADRRGMGLALMQERVSELGGDLRVDAAPGKGTAVVVRLPADRGGMS